MESEKGSDFNWFKNYLGSSLEYLKNFKYMYLYIYFNSYNKYINKYIINFSKMSDN